MKNYQAEVAVMRRQIGEMYAAHGKRHDEAIVEAHLEAWAEFRCPPCYAQAIRSAKRGGKWPLSAVQATSEARDLLNSSEHTAHIGAAGQVELDIGSAEAFWRGPAADTIAATIQVDLTSARFLAAKMFGSGAVPSHVDQVRDEFSVYSCLGEVWIAHLALVGGVPVEPAAMEAAFATARTQVLEDVSA